MGPILGESRPPVWFIDANVLASAARRQALLAFADAGLVRVRWSEPILAETGHAHARIIDAKPGPRDGAGEAARLVTALDAAFPEAMADADAMAAIPITAKLPDRGDEHVIQGALASQAELIVTENLRDFPAKILSPMGLAALGADQAFEILCGPRLDAARDALLRAAKRLRLNPDSFGEALNRAGLKRTAAILRG